jgi:hypothetical protein
VHFLAEAPFRTDAEAITNNQHTDHQLGINRGSAHAAVEWRQLAPQLVKFDKPVD